ncbi:2-hydroxymuconate tautomerase [Polycyclovorans algicola]|jgi:4-oxalocrotonate tautomerase|uniref:2-hydroxymuconate tautomerase n=1 Tax=Polycyclovorans algicola TaxID=616992 RepID=UPI0004A77CCC|nr:2-hydroxymuconate tautomerase [Polycyclovorans algicola]
MPVIQVNLMQGRTNEQKKLLAQRITQSVVEVLGAKPESVRVLIHEMGPYDFAVGGVPMAERKPAPTA